MQGQQPKVHREREIQKLFQQHVGHQRQPAAHRSRTTQAGGRPERPRITETVPTTSYAPTAANCPQQPAEAGHRRLPAGQGGRESPKQFQQHAGDPSQPAAHISPPKLVPLRSNSVPPVMAARCPAMAASSPLPPAEASHGRPPADHGRWGRDRRSVEPR